MVQSDLKKYCILKEIYTFCIMAVLSREAFREEIEKLVRLLFYTTKDF